MTAGVTSSLSRIYWAERTRAGQVPAPDPNNDAHAEIVCAPELLSLSKTPGRRLLEALVRLADDKWVIPAYEFRDSPPASA